jgi:ribosome-binding factor A
VVYKFESVKINKKNQHLEQVIKKQLINILQIEVQDPRTKWVTINDVKFNKDKSFVYVYYSVLGAEEQIKAAEEALKSAKGFIRAKLSQRLEIYKTPALKFIFDVANVYNNTYQALQAIDET